MIRLLTDGGGRELMRRGHGHACGDDVELVTSGFALAGGPATRERVPRQLERTLRPFVWTRTADEIIGKINGKRTNATQH
jgi:hypothetical protein